MKHIFGFSSTFAGGFDVLLLESNKSRPLPLEFKLDQEMPILPLADLQRCPEILNKLKSDGWIGGTRFSMLSEFDCFKISFIHISWQFRKHNCPGYNLHYIVCFKGSLGNKMFLLNTCTLQSLSWQKSLNQS